MTYREYLQRSEAPSSAQHHINYLLDELEKDAQRLVPMNPGTLKHSADAIDEARTALWKKFSELPLDDPRRMKGMHGLGTLRNIANKQRGSAEAGNLPLVSLAR